MSTPHPPATDEVPKVPTAVRGRLEYRFLPLGADRITVALNSASFYTKTISFALELETLLLDAIPFEFHREGDTQLNVLGGVRVSGMLSVEIVVKPAVPIADATALLLQAGFSEGLELAR